MQPALQGGVSPFLMTIPHSPQHLDQANQVIDELSEQDAKSGPDLSPQSLSSHDLTFGMDQGKMGGILNVPIDLMGTMPPWLPTDKESYLERQHNHYLRKGLRTPSSLGSPPLSAAPTSVPSPRLIEADSNGSVNQDGSSDDACREHALEVRGEDGTTYIVSQTKEMLGWSQSAAASTTPAYETAQELLSLEAPPCPASPSRR
jgi:hypothetical protein